MKRLLPLCCAVLLVLALAACGGSFATPQKTAAAFFRAMQTLDVDAMNACGTDNELLVWDFAAQDNGDAQQVLAFLRDLAAQIDYSVTETAVEDDRARVAVTVQYADASLFVKSTMTDVMANMMMALFGEDVDDNAQSQFYQLLREKLKTETPPLQTADVTLQMVKTDDGWRIEELPDALLTVMTGNTTDMLQEAAETFSGVAGAQVEP